MAFPRLLHTLPAALLAAVALLPAGCGRQPGVESYSVPKESGGKKGDGPGAGNYRLLGLMVPADEPVWFFKYNGPADEITKFEAGFDKLAASIKHNGDKPPEFSVPEGWERGPGRDGFVKVFATVKPAGGTQEVTVTQSGGGVKPNLDRWVGMIGLQPGDDDEKKYTKVIDGQGVKVLRVDMRGPKDPTTKRGPVGRP